jgi:Sugar (and other) transporter
MATVWIYPPEILPLKIRAKGASLAAAADFLGNFLVVEITPPALKNIGYKTYIIFAIFNIANAIIVWCFYPETAGQTLESVDRLFITDWQEEEVLNDRLSLVKKTQWSVVRKAREMAKNGDLKERNLASRNAVIQKDDTDQPLHVEAARISS